MPRFHCPTPLATRPDRWPCRPAPRATCRCCACSRAPHHAVQRRGRRVRGAWSSSMGRSDVQVRVERAPSRWSAKPARAVHLAVGMPANERMDWLVEKATELGAASIQPLLAERSVLRLKGERAEQASRRTGRAIAIAACEQCGRNRVPPVHDARWTWRGWLQRCCRAATGAAGDALAAVAGAAGASALPRPAGRQRPGHAAVRPGRRPEPGRRSRGAGGGLPAGHAGAARAARRDRAAGGAQPLADALIAAKACMNRNLGLLALCQGLFLTNNVTFIAINGLVGLALAPLGWMATLPVMGYVVGGALSTGVVAQDAAALRPQGIVPGRAGGRAAVGPAVRLCGDQPQFLAAVLRHRWWPATTTPTPTCTASPRPNWPAARRAKRPCRW